jgi:hypothetical protein
MLKLFLLIDSCLIKYLVIKVLKKIEFKIFFINSQLKLKFKNMKKLLLSITLFASSLGFSQILSQDFEGADFPPTGWTTETNVPARPWGFTNVIFTATGQTTFTIAGVKSAAIGWIAQDQDAHLTSPAFSLVNYTAATLAFKTKIGYEYMVAPFPNGDLQVEVSTDGTTWNDVWVEEDYGVFADYVTLNISVDLASYLGQSAVQVRFHYVGNDADSLSVDDVLVTGTLSNNEVLSSNFSTFPNPVNEVVNIKSASNYTINSVSITDLNGRTIKTVDFNNLSEAGLNVAELNAGVYFLNITSDVGKAVKKFVKN